MRPLFTLPFAFLFLAAVACAQDAPATQPAGGKLPHLQMDVKARQLRVECEALNVEMPLEFFCCVAGTVDHETVLRTQAKPSDIHLSLLMMGLKPGEPVHYSEATQKWIAPHGPPLHINVEYQKDNKTVTQPAYRWMRNTKTKKEMPPLTWVFCGSRVMEDGKYAADTTGYVVDISNFDLAMIDVPNLVSNSNETLEWEFNPDLVPKAGTKVWMIIEPTGKVEGEQKTEADVKKIDQVLVTVDNGGQVEVNRKPVDLAHLTETLERLKAQHPLNVQFSTASGAPANADPKLVKKVRTAIEAADVPVQVVAAPAGAPTTRGLSGVTVDQAKVDAMDELWRTKVGPHAKELRDAAQAHYEAVTTLRREQQRLIDEADRVQRKIDELEAKYQDMTTPHPANQD